MNLQRIKKLNEEMRRLINMSEISDELKQKVLYTREKQLQDLQNKTSNLKRLIYEPTAKSNLDKIENLIESENGWEVNYIDGYKDKNKINVSVDFYDPDAKWGDESNNIVGSVVEIKYNISGQDITYSLHCDVDPSDTIRFPKDYNGLNKTYFESEITCALSDIETLVNVIRDIAREAQEQYNYCFDKFEDAEEEIEDEDEDE